MSNTPQSAETPPTPQPVLPEDVRPTPKVLSWESLNFIELLHFRKMCKEYPEDSEYVQDLTKYINDLAKYEQSKK